MSSADHKAVFLSYASQDAEAARRIADALRAAGVEVWFDQSELVGGDAWDAKIRGQISSCALFVPVISANTQARREGYFRLEWKLAAQRTHMMSERTAFLLPVIIDATRDAGADVPGEFRAVQFTKLPGGETPPAFVARVQKLLGGETIGGALRPDSSEPSGSKAPPTVKPPRLWLIPALLVGLLAAGLALWAPWKKPLPPAPGLAPAAASLTPAQQLVAKARTILEQGDELNRETYALAEELLLKAEALDVTEASAWLLHAGVSNSRIGYGMDRSAARYEALRTQTARAVQLAPDTLDAQLAECDSLITFEQNIPALVNRLQALATKYPDDWRVTELLSQCYRLLGKYNEALAANDRSLQLSPDNPRLKSNRINFLVLAGRWAEAEASIDTLLQGRAGARLLAHAVYLKLMWSGDAAGAAAAVQSWPDWFLLEDRGVVHAALAALWIREPNRALEVVRRFPRDYIRDFLFTGPGAVLSAWANEQAGNAESARADWRIVLQVTERELRSAPDDPFLLHWKAWALARLGDTPAAASLLQQLLEKNPSLSAMGQVVGRLGGLAQMVGHTDVALAQIALNPPGSRAITKTILRLSPVFDPMRRDPRFQALIDAALGPAEKKEAGAASVAPDAKSVAVLAFANLSDDKANEYFSDGISEELLNVLAKVPGLKVSARTSAFHFKGKDTPIREIGQQLGVAYVVEGSVRKAGDKVRITAQLIKAVDGFHVWSDTFTRDLKDIFAVQDEIAGLIAQQLQLKLGAAAGPKQVVNPEAYALVLEGRHFLTLRTATGFDQAERVFSQALKLDPQFAQAQAGLATTTALRGRYRLLDGVGRVEEFDQLAIAQSRLALQMDPSLAEPHAAIGFVLTDRRQLAEAEQEFQKAFAANPNYSTAYHWHSHVFGVRGRLDLALKEIGRATTLDPLSFIMTYIQGFYTCDTQQYAEALAILDRAASLRSDTFLPLEADRAHCLFELGRKTEALAVARKVLGDARLLTAGWYAAGEALHVLHQAGETAEAARLAEALIPAMPPGSYQRGYALCALGNFREGLPQLATMPVIPQHRIYFHPMFDLVRDTPEFRQLLVKLGCVEEYKVARATLARMQQAAKK